MTSSERFEAAAGLRACARFFGKAVDEDTIAEYVDLLSDLELRRFEEGLSRCKASARYFPKPIEIRRAAGEQAPALSQWRAPEYATMPDGEVVRVYACLRCQDTGWRPACGCDLGAMGVWRQAGECPTHPRVVHGLTYRQAMVGCECRGDNPTFQASQAQQRPHTAREEP